MTTPEVQGLVQAGIAAAKAGEREKARELLLQVVAHDEQNELAWLWLSGVVEADEDRRICLENVLAINPDNRVAQKGLTRLPAKTAESVPPSTTVRKEHAPISPAAAVLYPERQVHEWEWRDPTRPMAPQEKVGYQSRSAYDDVWTQEVDLCPFCAQVVPEEEKRCPRCKHVLMAWQYRDPHPSSHLHMLWVLLLGLGQLYLIEAIFRVVVTQMVVPAILPLALLVVLVGLAAGVYYRQFWAYLTAVILLILILVGQILTFVLPIDLSALGLEGYDTTISNLAGSLVDGVGLAIRAFSFLTAVLALFFAVVMAGPDFERNQFRQLAVVGKGLSDAIEYHSAARRLAEAGMWAAAVLHWQHAAAKDPTRVAYQKHLGEAYARLGFYERGLDVLQAALQRATNPIHQTELKQVIQQITEKQNYGK